MTVPPEIEVRYTPAMVHGAVRTFVSRRVGERIGLYVAATVLLLASAYFLRGGDTWLALVFGATPFVPLLLALVMWFAHDRRKMRALRRMGEPVAWLKLEPAGLHVRSGAGEGVLPFSAVQEVWTRPDCWLLVTASNDFTILPTASLPAAWRDAIEKRAVTGSPT